MFVIYIFLERTEMVEIQLDTYTVDSISAHRKMRQDTLCFLPSVLMVLRCYFPLAFSNVMQKQYLPDCYINRFVVAFLSQRPDSFRCL